MDSFTALAQSIQDSQEDNFLLLLKDHGYPTKCSSLGNTILHIAAQHPRIIFLKALLGFLEGSPQKSYYVNSSNKNGDTALQFCAVSGLGVNAALLIKHGADCNARNRNRQEPFSLTLEPVNACCIE